MTHPINQPSARRGFVGLLRGVLGTSGYAMDLSASRQQVMAASTKVPATAPVPRLPLAPQFPMSREAHWSRLTAVVDRALSRGHDVNDRQDAARQQLDAAEYALDALLDDLGAVMPGYGRSRPGATTGSRRDLSVDLRLAA
jgi:type VI protein secretion system component VasF